MAPKLPARVLTIILLVFTLVYFLFPIVWVVFASSKSNSDLVSTFGFWFSDDINWAGNWSALMEWTQGLFPRWVLNSIFYSTASAVVGTLLAVSAGYAMAKFNYPGRSAMLGTIMVGLLMPVALLTVPMYLLFSNLGLNNTIWSILIPCMVSPFGVFLGNVYATTSVPTELLEAARIDGAGEARIFFTMVLRLLAPAMVTIFLFIFVATWNNFMLPLMMLSSPELKPVTLGLYGMMSYFSPDRGAVLLGSLVGVLPLIVLFLFLQRYWQSGLAAGAVKG
ncbi:carbohydrate ABC transporter permease [Tessaracoccus coleopterorum]|uniref:carbohydrate ABC transporter permease n=1 Tax=Tessaracoccus coleopterorum TaxID=2714950 RepID=UPI0038CD5618